MHLFIKKFLFIIPILLLPYTPVHALISTDGLQGFAHAKVVEVYETRTEILPGTNTEVTIQPLKAEILEGPQKGEIVRFDNDYISLKEGQKFFIYYLESANGDIIYSVRDVDRRIPLLILTLIFAGVIIFFGGIQGVRSIISLAVSFLAIIFILLPLLIQGYSPIIVSIAVGSFILCIAIFFTHGFNKQSLVAFLGTAGAVILTGVLAFISVRVATLSGFFSDETAFLNMNTRGILDFRGLLLGGIIIGALGVLDDIAITQVAVVAELKKANKKLTSLETYKGALRVGREHVSALVNTLVFAYAGVSLPLLLLFSQSASPFSEIINNEVFATEIVRTIVGSTGLIVAVPLTTILAIWILKNKKDLDSVHNHGHNH